MTRPELLQVLEEAEANTYAALSTRIREARSELIDLIADVRQAHAALTLAQTFPADIDLARKALAHALDRVGGKAEDRAPVYRLVEAAQRASALMDLDEHGGELVAQASDELYEAAKKVDELMVLTSPAPLGGDCRHLHLFQHTSLIEAPTRIAAILADDKATSAFLAENPGSAVLVVSPGHATVVRDLFRDPETDEQRKAREAKDANDGR